MRCRIGCRSRADIAALDVADYHKPFFLTVINCFLERDKPGNTELLVHRNLRLDSRNQIIGLIYDSLVVKPHCLRCAFERLALFGKSRFLDVVGDELHCRVKPHHDGCPCFLNLLDEFINHNVHSLYRYLCRPESITRSLSNIRHTSLY